MTMIFSTVLCAVDVTDVNVSNNEDEMDAVHVHEEIAPSEEVEAVVSLSKDPYDWEMNDFTTDFFARNGFQQDLKILDFDKSKRLYSDQARYCPPSIFTRKSLSGEKKRRDWLIYSEKGGFVICGPCLLLKNEDSSFGCKEGFSDWKNIHTRVQGHEKSSSHKSCLLDFVLRGAQVGSISIDHHLKDQLKEETKYWRNVLKRVIAIVLSLATHGQAFRGKTEKIGDPHNGNFLMCVELLAKFDPFFADHVARFSGRGSGNVNYLSSTIFEELINLMANYVREKIVKEIKEAVYFCLIVDSTPSISHVDELAVVIRYVSQHGEPVERFLSFLPNVGHKGEQMEKGVTDFLENLNIDMKNCRGQSYDSAASMSGKNIGLQSLIKKNFSPYADYLPCAGHQMNLAGDEATASCRESADYFLLLQSIYNFFEHSTDRWAVLNSIIEKNNAEKTTLKSLSVTRWSAREDASRSLRKIWKEVYETLKIHETKENVKPAVHSEVRGLRLKFERFETAIMACFWGFVLEKMNKVQKSVQGKTTNALQVIEHFDSLICLVESKRDKFEEFEEQARAICLQFMKVAVSDVNFEN
jgi:hypothetical protein